MTNSILLEFALFLAVAWINSWLGYRFGYRKGRRDKRRIVVR